jgi:transcriptional regulator with XRE-family HTH domain
MDRGNLGERVRAVRKARDLSQEALARDAGVSLNLVNKLERGVVTDPHYSTLSGIAGALGMTVEQLVEEPVLAGKAKAPRETGPQAGRRPNSAQVVASLHDHAQIFRALADRLASGLEQVRAEELPALVFESVWVVNGASKMMAENVAPLLEDARPEELEAGQEAERALKDIERVVYAIRDRAERHNAIRSERRKMVPSIERIPSLQSPRRAADEQNQDSAAG